MPAPEKVSRADLERLIAQGKTNKEMAEELGVGLRTIARTRVRYGLESKDTYDHSQFIPWRLTMEHSRSGPTLYLRLMSRAAQGGDVPAPSLNTAIRWATKLVNQGWDIDYDPEYEGTELSEDGGWKLIPDDEGSGRLKELLELLPSVPMKKPRTVRRD
ncbi:hypothetical protein ACFWY5_29575 [Nonomuraea sp. NPDC059007]|uniref:hypothetical protein n=1 Tax=Nonomuraea sp. NPDC059007 TaxID=3346692 RepID=UPI00369A1C2F